MAIKFWVADTFSSKMFCGIPAAVFSVDSFDNDELLQNIAMEINTPETMFVKEINDEMFEAVAYTPKKKGLFFGNALYATARVVSEQYNLEQFSIMCGIRVFLVKITPRNGIQIRFSTIALEKVSTPVNLSAALSNELIVSLAECKDELVVEVRSPSRLLDLKPSMDMLSGINYSSIVVTADTHYETGLDYDICARVFAPNLGLSEDVISPIACAKLATYWANRMEKQALTVSGGDGEKVFVELDTEYTYITGNCVISAAGEMNVG